MHCVYCGSKMTAVSGWITCEGSNCGYRYPESQEVVL